MNRLITNAFVTGVICAGITAALGSRPATAAPPDQPSANLWVNYVQGDNIDAIDLMTHKVVRTIKGIPETDGMSFSPDGKTLYAASESPRKPEQVLYVVDIPSGKIIKTVPLSGRARGSMSISKDGKRLFIPWHQQIRSLPGGLDVIDTTTLERVKTIPMSSDLHDTYLTPDGKYVFAGSVEGHFLTVVDVQTEQPIWELKFDTGVLTMAAEPGPDGLTSRLFIMRDWFHGFEVLDFAKRQVVAHIALPETDWFKSDIHVRGPNGQAHGIGIAPDKKTLWADSRRGNAVFVYSLPDLKLLGSVTNIGHAPGWIAFSPDSKTVFDEPENDAMITVIDVQTIKEVDRIELEFPARRIYMGPTALP